MCLFPGEDFADSRFGICPANQKNAPILLVNKYSAVMDPVKEYIRENLTPGGTVYLLGGTSLISEAAANDIFQIS